MWRIRWQSRIANAGSDADSSKRAVFGAENKEKSMAGHSHSANIAVRKGKQDAARAKLYSKLSRYIIIAARNGGGDPEMNLKLRYAIDKARAVSMPRDNIDRAIKRGTGDVEGIVF